MASYRFCRPDDIPQLVQAINDCFLVHFPEQPPLTVEAFRTEVKELSVWPSNCMMAIAGDEPVAVGVATKRETEVLIYRVGAKPGHQRQGHCGHILTSLSQKLAVLGPERLVAEVPARPGELLSFFEAVGYSREEELVDYIRDAPPEAMPAELLVPIHARELLQLESLATPDGGCWERSKETMENRYDSLEGLAIALPESVEAYCLYRLSEDGRYVDLVALESLNPEQADLYSRLLVHGLAARSDRPIRWPRLAAGEVDDHLLASLSFQPGPRYHRCGATATPL